MTDSPQLGHVKSRTAKSSLVVSPPVIILVTALDTTWRVFVPVLGGVWAGIGLDHMLGITPVATIVCLVLGAGLSGVLVVRQLVGVKHGAARQAGRQNNRDKKGLKP